MDRESLGKHLKKQPQRDQDPFLVIVKGAGDLGSGVIWRLHRSGFSVLALEHHQPTVIRRTVAFASAIYEGKTQVEGIPAQRALLEEVPDLLSQRIVPVLADPEGQALHQLRPAVLVDAILAKRNLGTQIDDAPLVIALGPGFEAGRDCHAIVETARGHFLGRVYWEGEALPNTGIPGTIAGITEERVLRSPGEGTFQSLSRIGETVAAGQRVAQVNGQPVLSHIAGVVRGLLKEGLPVHAGMKVGDIDPRGERAHCFAVSDKALAVAGGVLEAIIAWSNQMHALQNHFH